MARVGRLAGAILAETQGHYVLIGNPKEPCDFVAIGFEPPGEIDAMARPFMWLVPVRSIQLAAPCLVVELEGEALARLMAERFLIHRNGSVSERLWRLVTDPTALHERHQVDIPAQWFGDMPSEIWAIVRDTVLKCT